MPLVLILEQRSLTRVNLGWFLFTVVPDGYGLSYSIGDNYIRWTITSLKRQTQELRRCLEEAAVETRDMMERAAKAEGAKPKL